ncbi:hypothetical protein D3C73_702690 [compost metagenome]
MPIHRAPAVLAFALDGVLQAAAVLPQIDPLAETVDGIGEQQLLAVIQRFGGGLQGFQLILQCLPAVEVGILVPEPFSGGREQRRELVHKLGRTPFQGIKRVVEGIDYRQQVNHPPTQLLGITHRLRTRTFVGQLTDHQLQGIERGDHRCTQRADFFRLHVTTEEAQAVGRCIGKPFAHRIIEHRRQAPRPEHGTDHRRHGDAEKDFFGPRLGHVPHPQRVVHHRQGDQRQSVTGEHQGVVVRGAQMQGQKQQRAGPQCNHHHQHVGALHEHRHEQNRRRSADKGADCPVQRLGAGRAEKRAGNDVHRGHRPVRTRHLHEQGDVQRNHRGGEGADPIEPVSRRGHACKKTVQELATDGGVAASKALSTRNVASRSLGSMPSRTSWRKRTNSTSTACTSSRPASVRLRHLARRSCASSVRQT